MNTKTMRLPPRRVLTSDKRVISGAVAGKPTETAVKNPPPPPIKSILKKAPTVAPPTTAGAVVAEPAGSNQLLAGYLAHEFLNKGTLFGEQWNPARAQAGPFAAQFTESRKAKSSHDIEPSDHKRRRYVEVANILRVDGTHLPGIVNPSQLVRSLKL
ncbi:hypothetical protein EUTSA_v10003283mg [Eutrema salsugineum]|uniref:Embryo sac development arrest 6 n=1 Tax=Eutrema salsugineum TaxID=72664 RepID=V4L2R9_EUTSA|nr:uncharacterized protein LOC18020427 [Eutrema salsugineum]ESQ44600.1 hypothetical protein EUTSA_v10003283mg [Eutrema salsugineum]